MSGTQNFVPFYETFFYHEIQYFEKSFNFFCQWLSDGDSHKNCNKADKSFFLFENGSLLFKVSRTTIDSISFNHFDDRFFFKKKLSQLVEKSEAVFLTMSLKLLTVNVIKTAINQINRLFFFYMLVEY